MKKRVAIICGGRSSEHQISCISARGVLGAQRPHLRGGVAGDIDDELWPEGEELLQKLAAAARARRIDQHAVEALQRLAGGHLHFTLANLFFGIFAIVAASRGEFDAAARYVVFGAIADTLDGRIARATKSGSRFGEELVYRPPVRQVKLVAGARQQVPVALLLKPPQYSRAD
mgnify:CR=1 FL=1